MVSRKEQVSLPGTDAPRSLRPTAAFQGHTASVEQTPQFKNEVLALFQAFFFSNCFETAGQ